MTHQESLGGGTRVEPRARVRDAASEDDGDDGRANRRCARREEAT